MVLYWRFYLNSSFAVSFFPLQCFIVQLGLWHALVFYFLSLSCASSLLYHHVLSLFSTLWHFGFMCNRCANSVSWTFHPAAGAAAGLSRCSCESMTAASIFSKALWWHHILSLCLQPRLFWWRRLSRHQQKKKTAAAGRHEENAAAILTFTL